ncbi:MAG: HAD-IA family hydrolase [Candidatus Sumerlaeaceae bacterium]|nr:HAD-IA family hydrolase [Candidatus Sumerlaeaceae bacterium]
MSGTVIECVLFDAGGTLLGTNTDSEHWYEMFFVDACRELGREVAMSEVTRVLHDAAVRFAPERRSSSPEQVRAYWEHVYGEAFRALVPGCDWRALAGHFIDRFEAGEFVQLFPDTVPALDMLRERGLKCGIVSNFGTYLLDFLRIVGIADRFAFVLVSAAEGCEKPEPEIFMRAIECAATLPERILFVGDSVTEDYDGPSRHGMLAVLIDRHDKHADKPHLRRVRRLTEIERYLNGAA